MEFGVGRHAVKDRFISRERYSGNSPAHGIQWSKSNGKSAYFLRAEFINSATIRNYNVSAKMTVFDVSLANLYLLSKQVLLKRPVYIHGGPVTEVNIYYRQQNIARGGLGLFDAFSAAGLISVGARLGVVSPLSRLLQAESFVQSNIVSLGAKFINPGDEEVSAVKVLLVPRALNLSFQTSGRYQLSKRFSMAMGYKLNLLRITAWDKLFFVTDQLYLSLSVRL